MNDEPEYEVTTRDLQADYDESKLDRVGKPLGIEEHNAGKPEQAEAKTAKSSHTLIDMSKDYEFFTTGVIHATTLFDRDPVAEFNKLHPTASNEELPVIIDYSAPFFAGLGVCLVNGLPANFDRRLYAIVRDRWESLRNTITGIAMMHRPTSFYARLNFYELEIVDPFALKKMVVVDSLPKVAITVFGVSSNKFFSYIQGAGYPQLPQLVSEKPKADMLVESRRLLGPPLNPESLLPK